VVPSILDGGKRDRYPYTGDLAQSGLTVYYSNGASDYVKGSLRLLGGYQDSSGQVPGSLPPQMRPGLTAADNLPRNVYFYSLSYSIYFVIDLDYYYLYTGDQAFARQEWPVVEKDLAYLRGHTNSQHLVVTDFTNGNDWAVATLAGTVAEYNMLYYRALRAGARLARAAGYDNLAAGYDAEADFVRNSVNATLFDAKTGLYDISDAVRGPAAQDANALAVLWRVAPASQQTSILQGLRSALYTQNGPLAFSPGTVFPGPFGPSNAPSIISPFISGFEARARFEAGDTGGALDLIRTVWGHMRQGGSFYSGATWEVLAPDGTVANGAGGTSLAHGWSSGATSALSEYVLGVRPVEAGYKTWLIEPQTGNLSWAEGTVPTPYGPIEVKWRKTSNGLSLEIDVPAGTSGTVGVPTSSNADSVTANDRPVKKAEKITPASESEDSSGARPGYAYLADLGPGVHVIQVTRGEK
jgi:alpha-L-rhamnosidase